MTGNFKLARGEEWQPKRFFGETPGDPRRLMILPAFRNLAISRILVAKKEKCPSYLRAKEKIA